ncbi:S-methyl-5-thioribose-1-phosphate isomerase [bacterium]|nr:S-methyl-5-thioribose-1-phosphate isomerase [candidate division CSSED10-310 bacterium]
MVETVRWDGQILWVLDQRRLPLDVVYCPCRTVEDVARSIKDMLVRGAPAIGVTAAFGMAIAAREIGGRAAASAAGHLASRAALLEATRPTAVNLAWATRHMLDLCRKTSHEHWIETLEAEAVRIYQDDIQRCRSIGANAAHYIPEEATILTHCNAGALATAGYGTALGVIRRAVEDGKRIRVFADETRPFLQGARLTAWELMQDGIDVTLITDSMAAHFMACRAIDLVVVGADRIASNGDTANKIGTYGVALAAHAHTIPFLVAAPLNTVDMSLQNGSEIPIEERAGDEVVLIGNHRIAPPDVQVRNPAFDVTPHHLITAIITDKGAVAGDFSAGLRRLFQCPESE